jgi:hypothetical protein
MSKWVNTAVLDGALNVIATADGQSACSGQPATYSDATSLYDGTGTKYQLAESAMTPTTDYTLASAGGVSARKVTTAQKTGVAINATATANYVALTKSTGSVLLYVTTCTAQALTVGNTLTFPTWSVTIGDPT